VDGRVPHDRRAHEAPRGAAPGARLAPPHRDRPAGYAACGGVFLLTARNAARLLPLL
jgi:hypothetical protein